MMISAENSSVGLAELIRRVTQDGVHDLEVEVNDQAVWLKGRCATFHCKKLAQDVVMHLDDHVRVTNQIEVV